MSEDLTISENPEQFSVIPGKIKEENKNTSPESKILTPTQYELKLVFTHRYNIPSNINIKSIDNMNNLKNLEIIDRK